MINVHDNYWIPSEGYKYLTNGEVFSDGIYLGVGRDINEWHDTNKEPHDPDIPSIEAKAEAYDILMGVTP